MVDEPRVAPYGSWRSPLSAARLAEGGVRLSWPQGLDASLYWVEMRPFEGGRYVLVRRGADGQIAEVVPEGFDARTLVHEYGGGMYRAFRRADGGESVLVSRLDDQRLYRLDLPAGADDGPGAAGRWSEPRPVTPEPGAARALRYADGRLSADGRLFYSVRERHEPAVVVNELVVLPVDDEAASGFAAGSAAESGAATARVVASGHDFYAAPRPSPDGRRLAWISWDHPLMPWDGTELWVAEIDADGGLSGKRLVAGGPEESVVQPAWGPDGRLHFISDRSGWWNLYATEAAYGAASDGPAGVAPAAPLAPLAAEFARPHWVFGLATYDWLDDGRLVTVYGRDGRDELAFVRDGTVSPIATPFTVLTSISAMGDRIATVAGSTMQGPTVAIIDPDGGSGGSAGSSGAVVTVQSAEDVLDQDRISVPEAIVFPTAYEPGSVTGPLADEVAAATRRPSGGDAAEPAALTAHALYYPPANPDFVAPAGERPPLLVVSHGGPTSAHEAVLDLDIQYWTTRGFAVVDVNYGGSTGYGRAYRERLKGNWGVVDTVDCINAARYLAARGDVDPARLAVRGGSAGGYTTLNALTRHRFFAAGASYFGLADLEAFVAGGTHKFEERYLIGLVGPYPEAAALYRERSPIHHVDDLSCPVILLQGLEDAIVPPAQAEIIVAALQKKGLPYAYLAFPGEQHGFRQAEHIVRAQEAELYFYGRVFGFTPADEIEPLQIENLG